MESDDLELGKGKDVSSTSSDEWESDEDDDNTSAGYTPLPQDPIENGEEQSCDDHHSEPEEEVSAHSSGARPEELTPSQLPAATSMDQGHADNIVKVMAGFNLSPQSIPEWAKFVPEDVWKSELLEGLKPKPSKR